MTATGAMRPVVLVIAGSDSSGGAGIAADVRTATALGADVRLAVTAVTAQGAGGVGGVHHVPVGVVREQIATAFGHGVGAVKVGMLGSAETVDAVAAELRGAAVRAQRRGKALPIVLDPVLAASSGGLLLDEAGVASLLGALMPLSAVTTPNLVELAALAARLGGPQRTSVSGQAAALISAGAPAILAKGGHAEGALAEDLLFRPDGRPPVRFSSQRSAARLRGTGCALSTAIAVHFAAGRDLETACRLGKAHLSALFEAAVKVSSERLPGVRAEPRDGSIAPYRPQAAAIATIRDDVS